MCYYMWLSYSVNPINNKKSYSCNDVLDVSLKFIIEGAILVAYILTSIGRNRPGWSTKPMAKSNKSEWTSSQNRLD